MSYNHLKHLCKQSIGTLVRPLGFVPATSPQAAGDSLSVCLAAIHRLGLRPKHIVDIGANRGGWTRVALRYFSETRFTLIEPQEKLKAHAQDLWTRENIDWHTVGVSNQSGTMMLTIYDRDDSCTFRHSTDDARSLGFEQVPVPVFTLDDLLNQNHLPIPEIVKIDAEGLDLLVLEGASQVLGQTEVLFLEAGVSQKAFPNTVFQVVRKMESHGYRVFDVTDLNRTQGSGALWLVELAFVRKDGLLDAAVRSYQD